MKLSKNLRQLIMGVTISCAVYPHSSSATIVTGTVKHIYALSADRIAFQLYEHDKASLNAEGTNGACIDTNSGTFIVDLSQPATGTNETGPAQYALLLSAQSQGKAVLVRGSDICLAFREIVTWIRIND